jgi:hypothetical protein
MITIPDARTIKIGLMNPYADVGGEVKEVLDMFQLKNFRGPIEKIDVELLRGGFPLRIKRWAISVTLSVIDVTTQQPTRTFAHGHWCPDDFPKHAWKEEFGRFLERLLMECLVHEMHECLLCEGRFFIDPHPKPKDP